MIGSIVQLRQWHLHSTASMSEECRRRIAQSVSSYWGLHSYRSMGSGGPYARCSGCTGCSDETSVAWHYRSVCIFWADDLLPILVRLKSTGRCTGAPLCSALSGVVKVIHQKLMWLGFLQLNFGTMALDYHQCSVKRGPIKFDFSVYYFGLLQKWGFGHYWKKISIL